MLFRRLVMVVLITTVVAHYAMGFKIGVHSTITEEALREMVSMWKPPDNLRDSFNSPWFTQKAIKEIVDANIAKDTCRPGENEVGVACTTLGSEAVAALANVTELAALPTWLILAPGTFPHGQFEQEHFDAEKIQEGNALLVAHRDQIRQALLKKDFSTARKLLGGALHAIQDFYAHSNWVELQRGELGRGVFDLEVRLAEGTLGKPSSFASGSPRVAGKQEYLCLDGNVLLSDLNSSQISILLEIMQRLPKEESAIIEKTLDDFPLTTGYFGGWDRLLWRDKSEVSQYLKCRHGDLPLLRPGIDKDSPGASHETAKRFAYLHTLRFLLRFLNDAELQKDPAIIVGFMGQPVISSLDPPVMRLGQDVAYLRVLGTGFTVENTKTKPTVLWDGKPLETSFISSTRLDARIQKADIATVRTVKIIVQQQEDGDKGDLTGKLLKSNVVNFTIDQPEADCPNAIRPHRHDPAYIDVNANRWNDTGRAVAEGQTLNIEVLRGSVVWRLGGLFTGSAGEATPLGDPTATPANTLLWIDPQISINQAPIGALIGMIVETEFLGDNLKPTIPLIEKPPQGVKFFRILAGGPGVGPLPATGRLYFGINDGGFFNNGGCFQARIVK